MTAEPAGIPLLGSGEVDEIMWVTVQARRMVLAVAVLAVTAGIVWWGVRAMRSGQDRAAPEALPEAQAERTSPPDGAAARADDPVAALRRILDARAQALVAFDEAPLREHYDLESDPGQWALEHEQRRLRYLRAWTDRRRLQMVSARSDVRVTNQRVSGDEAWLSVVQSTRLGYVYRDDPSLTKHLFGIGTRHAIQMVREDGRWVIRRDWYTDPLDEDTLVPEVTPADVAASGGILEPLARLQALGAPRCSPPAVDGGETLVPGILVGFWKWLWRLVPLSSRAASREVAYDRDKAVAYARTYCGGAWGCGNGGRYNPAYRDYTDVGGDCTNFASQVLHAGGLPMDGTWYYRRDGGSRAWVQTTGLLSYLLDTGRARLLARGTYADVVKASDRFPEGTIHALEPGDLIAYQEQGRVVHFAVVTGQDFRGYVVVDSHTADRRAVPWDVGWDQGTVYWLLSMRD
ncbi:amidase domain-containing protein [Geochorda subterranea]|uniref:Amidase domain-containing protein n=1 Tax=Geochorda subterranea TaxID=3109564 RepID=A0ABZ1BPY7_9FIRM|nr:amidase domain-containing protein [Limnochorda sp. LNt]WRP14613.1 amidase domain-containing protein [Limnochorda sp. LNt]